MARAVVSFLVLLCCLFWSVASVSIVTDTWIQMPVPDSPPSPRDGHTAVLNPVNNTMILFGGKTSPSQFGALNNITTFLLETDEWVVTTPTGTPPQKRYFHSAIVSTKNEMIVFGGKNETHYFNDIAVYDLVGNKWVSVVVSGNAPTARYGHSAVYDPLRNRMLVYGGVDANSIYLKDIVMFDLATYRWVDQPLNTSGVVRAYHSASVSFLNVMIVFGGYNAAGSAIAGTSCFSLTTYSWFNCLSTSSQSPDPRAYHTAVMSPLHKMVIFGGKLGDGSTTDEVWNFDLFTYTWQHVDAGGISMNSRYSHSAIASPFGTMVLWGGIISDGSESDEFAKYNLATTVLRNANDGAVMVVLISLVGSIMIGMCYAIDYLKEQSEIDKEEAVEKAKQEVSILPKIALPKIPLGPKAQKFFDDFKVALDPLHDPPK